MDNDAARHDFANVLALVREQMQDLSTMQQKRAALSAKAAAADGTVEVTVDARCMVTEIVIDETMEEFELAELGGHIAAPQGRLAERLVGRLPHWAHRCLSAAKRSLRSPGWSMCPNSQKSFRI